ncbi:KEOPS complex subunit Pcc1 [Natronorarus salvus]|uniref:KEOPS complex subunit Pcc1 n=1 Tax=Natronorarus salvus TaxID=3117733 RepID=UPI002F26DBE5
MTAHDAIFEFTYPTERRAQAVERAVTPEVDEIEGERSRATVSREGETVLVTIGAADLVALRAGINTWCSLVSVAERVAESAERAET